MPNLTRTIITLSAVATWFATSLNSFAGTIDGRFFEVPYESDTYTYDFSTVEIIQPGRFTIIKTTIENPDVMRYNLNVLPAMRNYCNRIPKQYEPPSELSSYGLPDMPLKDVEVSESMVTWYYPYKTFAGETTGGLIEIPDNLYCRDGKGRTEAELFSEAWSWRVNGFRQKEFYDCRRGLVGSFLETSDGLEKAFIHPVATDMATRRYAIFRVLCSKVTNEAPYEPQSVE